MEDRLEAAPERPLSAVGWAALHMLAGGNAAAAGRLRAFVLDPADTRSERWQVLRAAERDAWKAVELLLLRKGIERRFRQSGLDAWERQTPFGAGIRSGLEDFLQHYGSLAFPSEPQMFTAFALLELRTARLCGLLHAESVADAGMASLHDAVAGRFPELARLVLHPVLNIPGMAVEFLHSRVGEMRQWLPTPVAGAETPTRTGALHLARAFRDAPNVIEEFIGDILAEATLGERLRRAGALERSRRPPTPEEDAELEREAGAEVEKMLGSRPWPKPLPRPSS
jgi:hypothetical protein